MASTTTSGHRRVVHRARLEQRGEQLGSDERHVARQDQHLVHVVGQCRDGGSQRIARPARLGLDHRVGGPASTASRTASVDGGHDDDAGASMSPATAASSTYCDHRAPAAPGAAPWAATTACACRGPRRARPRRSSVPGVRPAILAIRRAARWNGPAGPRARDLRGSRGRAPGRARRARRLWNGAGGARGGQRCGHRRRRQFWGWAVRSVNRTPWFIGRIDVRSPRSRPARPWAAPPPGPSTAPAADPACGGRRRR